MGRMYTVEFNNVAVTALQDLINLTATSGMAFKLHRIELGQKTLTSWEAKEVKVIRFPATVTAGSGGTSATPQKLNSGDAAATVTAHVNDTTPMTTNATASIVLAREWELLNGFSHVFAPDERPVIAPSQGVAINLGTAPSGSMTCSGTVVFEELY